MNELDKFTDEELKSELKKRREKRQEEEIPSTLASFDLQNLKENCFEYLLMIVKIADRQYDHSWIETGEGFVFKSAMETFYGTSIWNWIKEKVDKDYDWSDIG